MTDYTELVKALRLCAENFGCPIECPRYSPADEGVRACVSRLEKDAAAAIEALQKILKAVQQNSGINFRMWEEAQAEVKRLQDKLCDWCAVCPKERRRPEDCELLSETPVMYGPSDANMEVQVLAKIDAAPLWDSSTTYQPGDKVMYHGKEIIIGKENAVSMWNRRSET